MQAFHGKQEVKEFYLARVRAHRAAEAAWAARSAAAAAKDNFWRAARDEMLRLLKATEVKRPAESKATWVGPRRFPANR